MYKIDTFLVMRFLTQVLLYCKYKRVINQEVIAPSQCDLCEIRSARFWLFDRYLMFYSLSIVTYENNCKRKNFTPSEFRALWLTFHDVTDISPPNRLSVVISYLSKELIVFPPLNVKSRCINNGAIWSCVIGILATPKVFAELCDYLDEVIKAT